jgi:hypothetical protein
MTSDEKTSISSLLNYENSDLFTIGNISKQVTLHASRSNLTVDGYTPPNSWISVIQYLPLEFFSMIESYNIYDSSKMYNVEKFDHKYAHNPKLYVYDKYGITNMWRPIMILNKCPSIIDFDFDYIKFYDMNRFENLMSVLISRMQHSN